MSRQPLPAYTDLERLVLGYCVWNCSYIHEVRGMIQPDDFALDRHRKIWTAVCELYDAGTQVDRVAVYQRLLDKGSSQACGGLGYIVDLDNGLPEIPAIAHYVKKLREATIRRRVLFAASHMAKLATDEMTSVDGLVERWGKSLDEFAESSDSSRPASTTEMVTNIGITELLSPRQERGVPLPWPELQRALGGLAEGQVIVLMAATSRGKTSMALQIAACGALHGIVPAVWTMEMSPKANFQRMVTQLAGSFATKQFTTRGERDDRARAIETLVERPIYFDSTSRSVASFLANLRSIRSKHKLGLVVVDHLQLIRSENSKNRAQEVSENSRALKLAAMDFGIPFLILCQVDRNSVKGDGKIGLHSAKESGDIENDADVVMWIDAGELSRDQPTTVALHVGKQREGPSGFSIPMVFQPHSQTFVEVQRHAD